MISQLQNIPVLMADIPVVMYAIFAEDVARMVFRAAVGDGGGVNHVNMIYALVVIKKNKFYL